MPSEFARRLGQAIAARRKAVGITQEGLAERAGTSAEWISQVERGVGNPSLQLIESLSAALGVPEDELIALSLAPYTERGALRDLVLAATLLPDAHVRVLLATATALAATNNET